MRAGSNPARVDCLTDPRRHGRQNLTHGECRRDYMILTVAGSNPAGLWPVAQRLEHESVSPSPRCHGLINFSGECRAGLHPVTMAPWGSLARTSSPEPEHHGECRPDYMELLIPRSRVRIPPGPPLGACSSAAERVTVRSPFVAVTINAAGECRRDYIGRGLRAEGFESPPGFGPDVSPSSSPVPKKRRRMPAGLQGEHPPKGGRSAVQVRPGASRVAQQNVSPTLVAGTMIASRRSR